MRRDWSKLLLALFFAGLAYQTGYFVWAMVQSPGLVRQALEALNVTFWFWMPIFTSIGLACGAVWFFVWWWRENPIPSGEH